MPVEKLNNHENLEDEELKEAKRRFEKLKADLVKNKETSIPENITKLWIKHYIKECEHRIAFNREYGGIKPEEEKIIWDGMNNLFLDIKKHPTAYIMSREKLKKIGLQYSDDDNDPKYGFINYPVLRKELGAGYTFTKEEYDLIDKYSIMNDIYCK